MNVKQSGDATNLIDRLTRNPKPKALAIKAMCAHCVDFTQMSLERGLGEQLPSVRFTIARHILSGRTRL
ncbi:MAG: hypothetical protein ACI9SB_002936 [Candidatus Azotimanducaceae bacterium]|jgi:hypothetical protein